MSSSSTRAIHSKEVSGLTAQEVTESVPELSHAPRPAADFGKVGILISSPSCFLRVVSFVSPQRGRISVVVLVRHCLDRRRHRVPVSAVAAVLASVSCWSVAIVGVPSIPRRTTTTVTIAATTTQGKPSATATAVRTNRRSLCVGACAVSIAVSGAGGLPCGDSSACDCQCDCCCLVRQCRRRWSGIPVTTFVLVLVVVVVVVTFSVVTDVVLLRRIGGSAGSRPCVCTTTLGQRPLHHKSLL